MSWKVNFLFVKILILSTSIAAIPGILHGHHSDNQFDLIGFYNYDSITGLSINFIPIIYDDHFVHHSDELNLKEIRLENGQLIKIEKIADENIYIPVNYKDQKLLSYLKQTNLKITVINNNNESIPSTFYWLGRERAPSYSNNEKIEDISLFPVNRSKSLYYLTKNNTKINDNLIIWKTDKDVEILPSEHPYLIEGTILVPEGINLNIKPGTKFLFKKNSGIISGGKIESIGEENNPIMFLPYQSEKWSNITIHTDFPNRSKQKTSVFEHCVFVGGNGRNTKINEDNENLEFSPSNAHNFKSKTKRGGALLVFNNKIDIRNCIFSDNNATQGGAVFIRASTEVDILSNLFYSNFSTKKDDKDDQPGGGALYIRGSEIKNELKKVAGVSPVSVYIKHNSFINNYTKSISGKEYICGGAIYFANYCIINEVSENTFLHNSANYVGGAIYCGAWHEKEKTYITNINLNLFISNQINNPTYASCGGSSVAIDEKNSTITLSNNWFLNDSIISDLENDGGFLRIEKCIDFHLSGNYFCSGFFKYSKSAILSLIKTDKARIKLIEHNYFINNQSILKRKKIFGESKLILPNPGSGLVYFDDITKEQLVYNVQHSEDDIDRNLLVENILRENNTFISNSPGNILYSNSVLFEIGYKKIIFWGIVLLLVILFYIEIVMLLSKLLSVIKYADIIVQLSILFPFVSSNILRFNRKSLDAKYKAIIDETQLQNQILKFKKNENLVLIKEQGFIKDSLNSLISSILMRSDKKRYPIVIIGASNFPKENFLHEIKVQLNNQLLNQKGLISTIHKLIGYSDHLISALLKQGNFVIIVLSSHERYSITRKEDMIKIHECRNLYSNSKFIMFFDNEENIIPGLKNNSLII